MVKNRKNEKFVRCMEIIAVYTILILISYELDKNNIFHMFCSDDAGAYSMRNGSIFGIVFEKSYKYRPISMLFMYFSLKLFPLNIYYLGYYLIALNTVVATTIYFILTKERCNRIVSFGVSFLYLVCRFSYYQVTQLYGMMEGICTLFAIWVVYLLYKYNTERQDKWFYWSMFFYILVSLSHERYAVLIIPMLWVWGIVFFDSKDKRHELKKIAVGFVSVFLMAILLKSRTINILVGTAGTDITSSFSMKSFFEMLMKSILYLFGVNGDDTYLSLIGWNSTPDYIQWMVRFTIIMVFLIFICSVLEIIKADKKTKILYVANVMLFVLSIGTTIAISSCTIRVEMRWIYFPYMILVGLLVYLCYFCKERFFYIKKEAFVIYIFGMIVFNMYARDFYGNLYYWSDYNMGNSLATETYKKYGEKLEGSKLILVTDYVIQSESVYTYEDMIDSMFDNVELTVVNNESELQKIGNLDNTLVLEWDSVTNNFYEKVNFLN